MRRRFTNYDKKIVAARQEWRCAVCKELLDETYHVDHIVPLHLGGLDALENAQALCVKDHAKKTVKEESDRLRRIHRVHEGKRATVTCTACQHVLSPYFVLTHKCH